MKHLLAIAFITLLALGTGCAWISPSSQTTSDAIQVHGHWTVTVTNPDGSVDAVHEFDNALGTDATSLITGLLVSLADDQPNLKIQPHIVFSYERGYEYTDGRDFGCKEMPYDPFGPSGLSFNLVSNPPHAIVAATMDTDNNKAGSPITLTAACTITDWQGEVFIKSVKSFFYYIPASGSSLMPYQLDVHNASSSESKKLGSPVDFTERTLDNPISINNNQILSFYISVSFE